MHNAAAFMLRSAIFDWGIRTGPEPSRCWEAFRGQVRSPKRRWPDCWVHESIVQPVWRNASPTRPVMISSEQNASVTLLLRPGHDLCNCRLDSGFDNEEKLMRVLLRFCLDGSGVWFVNSSVIQSGSTAITGTG